MQIVTKQIKDLKKYDKNAKKHPKSQIDLLVKNIERFGFTTPILIDKNNEIIAGHGRLDALKKLKMETAPCVIIDYLNEEEIKALRLADNKIAEMGEWDNELALNEFKELEKELQELTGFDFDIYNENDKDDVVPEEPKVVKSKLGDIYELGKHRVMCGDSTKDNDIDKLFKNTDKIKLIFTSPPYNMNGGMYENYQDNLKREEYIDFNLDIVNKWKEKLKGFIFWNISYNKNSRDEFIEIIYRIIKESGLKFLEMIVWNKKTAMPVISKEAMTRQYEDILVVGDDESIKEDIEMFGVFKNQKEAYFNTKTRKYLRNYWEISPLNSQIENHKACYPVELPARGISIMTNENDIVADPFGGSGSTLIACEKLNREGYLMELDPIYTDVIVQRYVDFTGNENIIKNGEKIVWKRSI